MLATRPTAISTARPRDERPVGRVDEGVRRNLPTVGMWCFAARDAVPNTVTSTDSPSAPPTCCITLTSPDAAPASLGSTPASAADGQWHERQAVARPEEQQRAEQRESSCSTPTTA